MANVNIDLMAKISLIVDMVEEHLEELSIVLNSKFEKLSELENW